MMVICHRSLLYLLFPLLLLTACGPESGPPVDFSSLPEEKQRLPENALAGMTTAEGVEVAQFAAEPLLTNPTNMAVDARGRVWVCEANNYRLPFNPSFDEREEGDRILILEDTDGDGLADDSKVFYQGPEVNAALGIAVLGNRVIVSHSPNIYVFTDEDGDDKPDHRDTLFTGIDGPDDDHGAHAFVFGPDGRYYFNYGNGGHQLMQPSGGPVVDPLGRPINNTGNPYREGMAFRYDPDSSFVEVLGYNFRNNYELTVDPFGTVWQSDNDDDGNRGCRVNFVMEYGNYGYKDEMTGAGWREPRPGMHEEIPRRHWHLNDPGVVPNLLQTGAGSPAGITYYTGTLLPGAFHQSMIHAEALHNVVRAYPTQPDGAGYTAEIVNLLKSEDKWFRPSDVTAAPDGSILVADWYDPGVGGNKMDDIQRGRVYRLAPDVSKYKMPEISLETPEGAVQALQNPNMDVFYQAWTKLHNWGPEAEAALVDLWNNGEPQQAAKALWLLARLPGKTKQYIQEALARDNADLRITGLRVARQLDQADVLDYIEQLISDPAPAVRRECAVALHYEMGERAAALWARLAAQYDGQDRWYLEALGIGSANQPESCFAAWREQAGADWNTPAGRMIVWRLRTPESTQLLTELVADPAVDTSWLPRYLRAYHFKPREGKDAALAGLLEVEHPHSKMIRENVLAMVSPEYVRRHTGFRQKVRQLLPELEGTHAWFKAVEGMRLREQAPQLLDYFLNGEDPGLQNRAASLLFEFNSEELLVNHLRDLPEIEQKTFFARMGNVQHPEAAAMLRNELNKKEERPFPVQVQLVESLGNTWTGQELLFEMLQSGRLSGDLKNTAALKLMNCWHADIRAAAPQYLSAAQGKEGVLPPVYELVQQKGNVEQGREVFTQYCATCHQVNEQGTDFGPDLSAIGDKLAKEALYTSILYPSAGINFGYEGFLVKLNDGTQVSGILTSDTEEKLRLKLVSGVTQEYDKSEVQSMEAMDQSLMTANLQAVLTERQLIDLVEYLTNLKTAELVE